MPTALCLDPASGQFGGNGPERCVAGVPDVGEHRRQVRREGGRIGRDYCRIVPCTLSILHLPRQVNRPCIRYTTYSFGTIFRLGSALGFRLNEFLELSFRELTDGTGNWEMPASPARTTQFRPFAFAV
jgi:hypothetical protein